MDFIRSLVRRDLETGKYDGRVVTRFPPEPNGFLHIGHAKSLCLNFGIASEHPGGRCHLRLDDTNPDTEKVEFVEAMKRDIRWLGFDWGDHLYHASDYFEQLYRYAHLLVDKGLAYVDSSTEAEIRERRGSVTEPGRDSPWRNRSPGENRDLFLRMRAGRFPDGSHVLRARIDMAHRNMVMRDPILYRIRHASHYRHGDAWPIYPMYDFAHCLSDSLERVTHSLCTLEFENNREIYDWLLSKVEAPRPRPEQTEFAPLVLEYVITSKSKLRPLVEGGHVRGWDDPRMPTLAGLRRRGVTPGAIRAFCEMVGVARTQSRVEMAKLDFAIRNDLNERAPRAFCVLDPLRVVLVNVADEERRTVRAPRFPGMKPGPGGRREIGREGERELSLGRVVYIERDDFREDPPPGFRRLVPGGLVRLKYAAVIRCEEVVKDEGGRVVELRCRVEEEAGQGRVAGEGRVRAAIHWVEDSSAERAEVRLYDRLFAVPDPPLDDLVGALAPESERVVPDALVEPGLTVAQGGDHYQFERLGYFFADPKDCRVGRLVLNRTVTLREGWSEAGRAQSAATGGEAGKLREEEGNAGSPAGKSRGAGTGALTGVREAGGGGPDRLAGEERKRYDELVALGAAAATAITLARSPSLQEAFRAARPVFPEGAAAIAGWLANDVARLLGADERSDLERLAPQDLAGLARAVDAGELSHRQGRRILETLLTRGGTLAELRATLDLDEIGDEAVLAPMIRELIKAYPGRAAAYRRGQRGLLGFFVGRVMRKTGGRADPRKASEVAAALLGGGDAGRLG